MPDDPAPAPPEEPRRLSAQDQRLLNEVTAMERALEAARDDAEVQALIAPFGFDPADLDARLALVTAAQQRIDDRALAIAARKAARLARKAADVARRKAYATFRKMARPLFEDTPEALDALNLDGEVPAAFNEFISHARTAYTNGAAEPYVTALSVRKYDAPRLAALTADLDALVTLAESATGAEARGLEATRARNTAARVARKQYGVFRDTVSPLLEPYPELLRRIGL